MVYLAIPRTGSTSVTHTICNAYPDTLKMGHHRMDVPVRCVKEGYFIWSLVRNPYARVLSHYRHRARHYHGSIATWSFAEYIQAVVSEDLAAYRLANDPPAVRWPKDYYSVEFHRLEDILVDWPKLPFWPQGQVPVFLHKNQATPMTGGYTTELAEQVHQYHRPDFEKFGYAEDSWQELSALG